MIISKTPMRISLFGGSTDYPSFYSIYGSHLLGFTIDKYCYVSLRKTPIIFDYKSKISYSTVEIVQNNKNILNNGVRGVFEYYNLFKHGYEIHIFNDLPAQTGLGASSSFIASLIKCLYPDISKRTLANDVIEIERMVLNEPGGIQDQIWASYGGFNSIVINNAGDFKVRPLPICDNFKLEFLRRTILIYLGKSRQSFEIAKSHDKMNDKIECHKQAILTLANEAYLAFEEENITEIGMLLHDSWMQKKELANKISNKHIDNIYNELQDHGMIGGKLLGAGGAGFIFGVLSKETNTTIFKEHYANNYINIGYSDTGAQIIYE